MHMNVLHIRIFCISVSWSYFGEYATRILSVSKTIFAESGFFNLGSNGYYSYFSEIRGGVLQNYRE